MSNYFYEVVKNLIAEDVQILLALEEHDAIAIHRAIDNQRLETLVKMSKSYYRKSFHRLSAALLINVSTIKKGHRVYITEYGLMALQQEGIRPKKSLMGKYRL